jgi:anti-sigma28 factor (negative regulator of flagellin synthesis)
MKVNGKDGVNVLRQLTQEELLKARTQKSTQETTAESEDAASVNVANSQVLSQTLTAQVIAEERRAKVEELKKKYREGTLTAASSDEIAAKFDDGINDMIAISGVAQGE